MPWRLSYDGTRKYLPNEWVSEDFMWIWVSGQEGTTDPEKYLFRDTDFPLCLRQSANLEKPFSKYFPKWNDEKESLEWINTHQPWHPFPRASLVLDPLVQASWSGHVLFLPPSGPNSSDTLHLGVKALPVFTGPCHFHYKPSSNPQSMPSKNHRAYTPQ